MKVVGLTVVRSGRKVDLGLLAQLRYDSAAAYRAHRAAWAREYRRQHPERKAAAWAKYAAAHREKLLKAKQEYYLRNRDSINQKTRERRAVRRVDSTNHKEK